MRLNHLLSFVLLLLFSRTALCCELKAEEPFEVKPEATDTSVAPIRLSPFTAQYELFRGDEAVGSATRKLGRVDANQWDLSMKAKASLMFINFEYQQESRFTWYNNLPRPVNFEQQDFNSFKSPRVQKQRFDWDYMKEYGSYKGKSWDIRLEEGTQDRLTSLIMLRLSLLSEADEPESSQEVKRFYRIPVSYKGDVGVDVYEVLGTINIDFGNQTFSTLKVEKLHGTERRRTFLWLDLNNELVPVRIQQFKDDEEQADMRLKSLSLGS